MGFSREINIIGNNNTVSHVDSIRFWNYVIRDSL